MRVRFVIFAMAGAFCAAAAWAPAAWADAEDRAIQSADDLTLSAEDARRELFGVRLSGVTSFAADIWSECVEPDGDTVYDYAGWRQRGRLYITDTGQACFTYDTDDHEVQHCFRITRRGDGYAFWGGGNGLFYTNSVERGVTSCPMEDAPIG